MEQSEISRIAERCAENVCEQVEMEDSAWEQLVADLEEAIDFCVNGKTRGWVVEDA